MREKKSQRANLEKKRSLFLSIGMTLSLSFVLGLFLQGKPIEPIKGLGVLDDGIEPVEEVMITYREKKTPPPPPPPLIVEAFVIEPDDVEIPDDIEFDMIDIEEQIFDLRPVVEEKDDNGEDDFLVFADQMPEFPGGQKALQLWISRHIDYPQIALDNGVQGKVYIQFIVDIDGEVTRVQVARSVENTLDNEAIRVVSKLPNFKPGIQNGQTVRVAYTVPILFKLQ